MRFIIFYYLLLILAPLPAACAQSATPTPSNAANDKVAKIIKSFAGRGVQSDGSTPTPPDEALKLFEMRRGFDIDLVASEPEISQPLFLSWDSRGRMWVVQYRQYQFPAGLKVVRYDQHLRAVFDKVPEPPPHGTPGADRITVFEDTNGDGLYDSSKDVLTGLNIVSSVQIGHGGIWVLNPPYLLFYADADQDDVPDGDPEVHLSGFGLQDTHAIANSMIWGPDGWLYGANGSTTIGIVSSQASKGVRFEGQCIWRYHPDTKIFEIYAEGGGNTFSLEIDSKGRVFSGTNGGGTRGFYYPQGSYSHKNWGKHGPLTNPYAYGFFQPMESKGDNRRFPQAFMIYEGGLFPTEYDGSIVSPNALQNLIWHSLRFEHRSTYRTVDQTNLLETSDRWFRPVYAGVGPDGGVYIGDWYDTRLSHVSTVDDWHKESGRVYRIRPTGTKPKYDAGDLSQRTSLELISLFDSSSKNWHSNKWVRRRAMLELGWRDDQTVVEVLAQLVENGGSLESLWALNLLDALSIDRAVPWLKHENPHIRRWLVRLLGDRHEGHIALAELAARESNVQVRSQLASTAKRLETKFALPILEQLLQRDEDLHDPHMPLLIWWALEAHADSWPAIERMFADSKLWKLPLLRAALAGRLMQRYASSGTPEELRHCARLVEIAPDEAARELLIAGLNQAFQGQTMPELPASLDEALHRYQQARGEAGIVLALRQGQSEAVDEAIRLLQDPSIDLGIRIELARAFGDVHQPKAVDRLIQLATGHEPVAPALRRVAIGSLAQYGEDRIAPALIRGFGSQISREHNLRATGCRTLASRKSWAQLLLEEVNHWRLKKEDIPADVIQRLRTYQDAEIVAAVEQAFGKPLAISAPEKVAEMKRLTQLLSTGSGDSDLGKQHFTKRCATCHKLFGEGNTIGPALDAYDRGNLKFWLPAIIEPSLEIREGFQSYVAVTVNGRVITGMIAAQDPKKVTLRTAENQTVHMARDDLEELQAISTSLMPENGLQEMTDQQIQDMFAYLTLGAAKK